MKITQQCRLVRLLLLLCASLLILYFVLAWSSVAPQFGSIVMHFTAKGMEVNDVQQMAATQWVFGILLAMPALIAMLYGLWKLNILLAALAVAGTPKSIFTSSNIAYLQSFSGWLALSTLLSIAELPARSIVWSLLPDAHWQKMSFSVNSEEFILLLICVVFYLVTGMMHEGRRLAEENEGFI